MEKEYTKRQRKLIAGAFSAAVEHLDDGTGQAGKYTYICYALEDSAAPYWARARAIVLDRLGGRGTVWVWLRHCAGVPLKELTDERVQAYRHAWLQELIREFSQP